MKKQLRTLPFYFAAMVSFASPPVLASGALIPAEQFASDPAIPGKILGDNCSACHGTQGRLYDESMPPIAGIPKQTFIQLMMDFKNEVRPSIVMNHVAKVFTKAEIERMADYFASVPDAPWSEEDVLKGGQYERNQ